MATGYGFNGVCHVTADDMEMAWTQTVGPRISFENGETWVYTGRMGDPQDFTSGMLSRVKFGCNPSVDCGLTETVAQVNVFSYPCELGGPLQPMSMEQGGLIAAAVGSVWIAAWAVRAVRSVLSDRESD